MDQSEVAIHLQPSLRTLQPTLQPQHYHSLQSLPPSLHVTDAPVETALFQHRYQVAEPQGAHPLQPQSPFEHGQLPHLHVAPHTLPQPGYGPHQSHQGNHYGILGAPGAPAHIESLPPVSRALQPPQLPDVSPENAFGQNQNHIDAPLKNDGQLEGLKLIPNPPNLEEWREKLFNVDDTITLTEDEFQTYFPHIDNVYSHRSTQRHKRKRFVSHYWDCRLKGRPPGTKKSTDPDKKKRKRVARERDLCDVKIKITEYFEGAEIQDQQEQPSPIEALQGNNFFPQPQLPVPQSQHIPQWPLPSLNPAIPFGQPHITGRKIYTIQRVNGNGGNGKADGVAGPHKHTLEESDRVKKNSVIRWMMKNDKEKKKVQNGDSQKKTYHKKATGNALNTVKAHSKEEDLKLYGSCFCPFVQRVWISLEMKNLTYQYIEVDPYKKPQSLLDVNPRGLVPALRHGPTWSCHESTVLMEYLEDLQQGAPLLPSDPQTRATCRLWADHINRNIIPSFYRFLQAQDPNDQVQHASDLKTEIGKLVDAADPNGPFFLGPHMSFVDVQIAPWVIRLNRVLKPYRNWPEPEERSRWATWVNAIENDEAVKRTTSTDDLYLDSYERYAENRPDTSQVANAVNSGRGLP